MINKPAGITSFDAVSRCRRIFHEKKAGHTGTLDPNASGLMLILLGNQTKLLPYCAKDNKRYHAGFSLGTATDTEDIWGHVTEQKEPGFHSIEEMQEILKQMTGQQMQVPPMYSALKVNGKKLYEIARQGKTIERKPRPITIYSASVCAEGENAYTLDASVSQGTYIRTLIADYAAKLGEIGCMTSLVRTGIEQLSLEDAFDLDSLNENTEMIPPEKILDPSVKVIEISTEQQHQIKDGKSIQLNEEAETVILKYNGILQAAYGKGKDGIYCCLRGLL